MDNLKEDIKFNCDVSDAKYWGFFSICGLLLRYRDLYRSENNLKYWTNINREDIAAWIDRKESRWPELEQREFRDLIVDGKACDPFDAEGINQALGPRGLVYGAGYGMYMKPTFFLAELKSTKEVSGLVVHTSGAEYARDLFTASAMLQGNTVFLRREPLSILLLYKFSEMNAKRNTALDDAFTHYGFPQRQIMDNTLSERLDELTDRYSEIVLCHEIAEFKEALPLWNYILAAAGDRMNEHYLRAIKDLIADTSDHGPLKRIVETKDRGALGLSVALLEGFTRALFPELRDAYAEFLRNEDWDTIEKAREDGYARLVSERERIVRIYTSSVNEDFTRELKKILPA
ncbi:MAG TPA: hypothetical protein VLN91_06480 [Nitrospirota bacterium]|nr:hypothetical protein [Nitrospirota bacterium]